MAIDYIIDKDCPVKQQTGTRELVELIKSRNRALSIYHQMLQSGHSEASALDASFFMQTVGADGESESSEVSVRDLLAESKALRPLAEHCQDCQLNRGDGFGCYQSIPYPITADAEKWLARLAQASWEKGLPYSILLRFILDETVQGEVFGELRRNQPGVFQELTEPVLFQAGDAWLSTDQLLDMLFAVEQMERTHQMFLLFLSGGVEVSRKEPRPEQFQGEVQVAAQLQEGETTQYWTFNLPPAPSDDPCIRRLKAYFRDIFAAFATGETISVDY